MDKESGDFIIRDTFYKSGIEKQNKARMIYCKGQCGKISLLRKVNALVEI